MAKRKLYKYIVGNCVICNKRKGELVGKNKLGPFCDKCCKEAFDRVW
jgi:hypothetical protein